MNNYSYTYFDFSYANPDLANFYGSVCFKSDNNQCFFAIDNDGVKKWVECSPTFYDACWNEFLRLVDGDDLHEIT